MMNRDEFKEVLQRYAGQMPVPVIAIAKDLHLNVYMTDDFSPDQSGSLVKEGDRFSIYVNENHAPTRRRFTVAHEIAHYVLHGDQFEAGQEHIDGLKQPVAVLKREHGRPLTAQERKIEIEANSLAAEILMPESLFTVAWEQANTVEEVAEKFEVSQAAASVRAQKLFADAIM